MDQRRGYSLAEIMTSLTIIGILAVVSMPSIGSFLRSLSAGNGSGQLAGHLRLARSRAILEGNDYLIQFTSATTYVVVDDDGGGNGIPGAGGYVAGNRGNWTADAGELVLGPFALPQGVSFATVNGARNPFTGQALDDPITFAEIDGTRTLVFHPNGTADESGFIALQPQADTATGQVTRCRVLEVLASTGAVATLPALR